MKKIGMFTRYTSLGASSRYRFYKYVLELIRDGFDVEVSPFFDDQYLNSLYSGKKTSVSQTLKSYFKRLSDIRKSCMNIIIEYELFPFIPYFLEKLFLTDRKYILNFDDNVWEKYSGKWFLRNKYDKLVENAAGVIVANDFLKKKVRKINKNVIKIPTALDPEPYSYAAKKYDKFTIVWIGTPVTYKYIKAFAPVFRKLAEKIDYELQIIARNELKDDAIDGVSMTFLNWSEDAESFFIPKSHVGVMPLTNDNFSQGKSSFKIFQYFASGIPAIASPVGENKNVIRDGKNGFLVNSESEWIDRIVQLHDDRQLLIRMSEASRASAHMYSFEYWTPELIKFIEKSLKA